MAVFDLGPKRARRRHLLNLRAHHNVVVATTPTLQLDRLPLHDETADTEVAPEAVAGAADVIVIVTATTMTEEGAVPRLPRAQRCVLSLPPSFPWQEANFEL